MNLPNQMCNIPSSMSPSYLCFFLCRLLCTKTVAVTKQTSYRNISTPSIFKIKCYEDPNKQKTYTFFMTNVSQLINGYELTSIFKSYIQLYSGNVSLYTSICSLDRIRNVIMCRDLSQSFSTYELIFKLNGNVTWKSGVTTPKDDCICSSGYEFSYKLDTEVSYRDRSVTITIKPTLMKHFKGLDISISYNDPITTLNKTIDVINRTGCKINNIDLCSEFTFKISKVSNFFCKLDDNNIDNNISISPMKNYAIETPEILNCRYNTITGLSLITLKNKN